jgi:hypothetical protein
MSGGATVVSVGSEPPEWFRTKDYKYLLKLDAAGWLHELERCSGLGVDLSEWESIGEPGWTDNVYPAFIGPPAVQVVDNADQSKLHALEKPSLLVQVYLNAPDGTIIEEFKKVLQLARQSVPSPVRRPGPTALSAKFTESHFVSWINHRIVEVCELDAWRGKAPKDSAKPTSADLGRWLFAGHADPDKEVAQARKVLAEAIRKIPALWAQVEALPPTAPKQR